MSKGKLKVALKNQKIKEDFEKKNAKNLKKPVKPVLADPESESDSKSEESSDSEAEKDQIDISDLPNKDAPLSKKEQRKLKKLIAKAQEVSRAESDEETDEEDEEFDLEKLAESESDSDLDSEEDDDEDEDDDDEDEEDEGDEDVEKDEEKEEEEDVPLSEAELDSDADVVPHSKLTVNNIAALKDSLARIALPWEKHPFTEHQSIVSTEQSEYGIKDIYDDTERELAFYRQGLEAVKQGRSALLKLKVPFSRPLDYFAEMVKSDEHMDRLKGKLLKEAADKKASEDAKKQRALKKFGKKVQNETLQERAKQKKETLEKIKSLKKKRGANEMSNDDEFQIALEEATAENGPKRAKPNSKRLAKDAKYGHGGQKRGSRRNDADSSADIYNSRSKKGKSSRPGKSKRSRN